jgi:hypothetical protein
MLAFIMVCLGLAWGERVLAASQPTNTLPEHGRVLIVQNQRATDAFTPQPAVIKEMFSQGLLRFTGRPTLSRAWLSLVSTQDIIGIKVHSVPGPYSGTRPAVVEQVIESLLSAGIDPAHIIVWDRRLTDLRLAGFLQLTNKYNITVTGAMDQGYDPNVSYPSTILGRLVFGDLEFGQKGESVGRRSYVSKLLTRKITKIINITPLLNHNDAGVSGVLYGLSMSAVDNTLRFESADRLATAIPEIYALPEIGDRVALNIVDALICQYRGEDRPHLNYAVPLDELWFSTDAVAVDVLAIEELDRYKGSDVGRKLSGPIYGNAGIMDLGVADPKQIRVERLTLR